jgi:monovalent cation:H+ antiporter-2, CPA2 family
MAPVPHDTTLIATIAAAFVLAFGFGFIASRLRLPPLVGYLAAGVMIGPFTPGFVGDIGLAGQLAEIGVILLMFGVGLHFSIKDLLAVRRIAIPGAVGQILTATLIGAAVAHLWGWSLAAGSPSASRYRWPAPWCCCARWSSSASSSRRVSGASRSAG